MRALREVKIISPGYRTAIFLFITLLFLGHNLEARVFNLYYLGGQSNMDGYGYVNQLPEELKTTIEGVMIYHGNTAPDQARVDGKGTWTQLQPGHGVGFRSDGKTNFYSNRFGSELTFGRRLLELAPNTNIAVIKYSRGGTSIDIEAAGGFGCWEPDYRVGNGVNQYDHFLATVQNALSVEDIDSDGNLDVLIPAGIIWMQGESDALFTEEIALRYESNLERLIDRIRDAFGIDDLPVVIGRISDSGNVWKHDEIVRDAQARFVQNDGYAALVTKTDQYGYSDLWHYDTEGYIDLGKEFAEKIFALHKQNSVAITPNGRLATLLGRIK